MSSNKKKLLVFGAGGHGKSALDTLRAEGKYEVLGLVDSTRQKGYRVLGTQVLGGESDLPEILQQLACSNFFIAVGDNFQRSAISNRLLETFPDIAFVSTVHPSAVVSPSAELGAGSIVMAGAVISAQSTISAGCIINTRASIDHDCTLAPFSSLAPGATLGGEVDVGRCSSVGLGSSVSQQVKIGADTVIGTGSAVVSEIPESVVAYGCPCKVIRSREIDESYL